MSSNQSYLVTNEDEIRDVLRVLKQIPWFPGGVMDGFVGNLEEHLLRFEPDRFKREESIRGMADEAFGSDGDLEIDPEAVVSEGDANGAYVMAWKWCSFEGTEFDKEKQNAK